MKILVCGANGFIGRRVARALAAAGHHLVRGVTSRRGPPGVDEVTIDYSRDINAATWLPRLEGIDAVVNAVGVLRDSARTPMKAIHQATPIALFDACAQAKVGRVVQISALGVAHGDTPYAATKRAADEHLLALIQAGRLHARILRPSVVYGPGGGAAELFGNLARLPVLALPAAVARARIQPVHVDDVAAAVVRLLGDAPDGETIVAAVGPKALTIAEFIASLRSQKGHGTAWPVILPEVVTRMSLVVGDAVPVSPWSSQALALLATDNTADVAPFAALLGHAPRDPGTFVD